MHYPTFLFYNITGGFLWAVGLTLLGFFLGSVITDINRYLIPLILLIIVLSFLPPVIHILKDPEERRKIKAILKERA